MSEITLSTGKKVIVREKRGQDHFIERRLLANCSGEGGANFGGMQLTVTIQTMIGITSVDGEEVKTPEDLAGIFEFMDKFTYDEWNELEKQRLPKDLQEKLEKAAKN
jgi:hypothetical protein